MWRGIRERCHSDATLVLRVATHRIGVEMSTAIKFADSAVEAWQKLHEDATACHDLQEYVAFGLGILHDLRQLEESVARKSSDPAEIEAFREIYTGWLAPTDDLASRLEAFAKSGYEVPVLAQLKQACAQVRNLLSFDVQRLNRPFIPGGSIEEIRARLQG